MFLNFIFIILFNYFALEVHLAMTPKIFWNFLLQQILKFFLFIILMELFNLVNFILFHLFLLINFIFAIIFFSYYFKKLFIILNLFILNFNQYLYHLLIKNLIISFNFFYFHLFHSKIIHNLTIFLNYLEIIYEIKCLIYFSILKLFFIFLIFFIKCNNHLIKEY